MTLEQWGFQLKVYLIMCTSALEHSTVYAILDYCL